MTVRLKVVLFFCMCVGRSCGYAEGYIIEEGPPFEKIYVTYADIVTMPDGIYYVDESGERTHVKTVLYDWDGMYVMKLGNIAGADGSFEDESYQAERYVYPNPTPKVHPRVWDIYE